MNFTRLLFIVILPWLLMLHIGSTLATDLQKVNIGSATFHVEIAQTLKERARGLMFRNKLPVNQGMLFVQPTGRATFWMKNTYIPLDLLYFDADGQLLQTFADTPPCVVLHCPVYRSETATVRYILEINAGEAARQGIQVGDRLQFE